MAPHIQTEAFAVKEGQSRGISVRGIRPDNFNRVTALNLNLQAGEAAIGAELAKAFDLKPGQDIVLALARGNQGVDKLPLLKRYRVKSIVKHRIYQKDLRLVYVDLKELAEVLDTGNKVNVVALNTPPNTTVENFIFKLEEALDFGHLIRPYWHDFQTLLDAVEIEKLTIGLILQIIVIISIFNVLAFIVFLNEKRSRELFLFRALGLGRRQMLGTWFKMVLILWFASCLLSIGMVFIFNWALANWSFLQLPGDIYYLEKFELAISFKNYALVFFLALGWLLFFSLISFWKLREKSIVQNLRKEFA